MAEGTLTLIELLEFAAVALLTGAVSTVGLYLERIAVATIAAGSVKLGVWMVALGGVFLYVGVYLCGYTQLLPRLRTFTSGG